MQIHRILVANLIKLEFSSVCAETSSSSSSCSGNAGRARFGRKPVIFQLLILIASAQAEYHFPGSLPLVIDEF